MQPPGMLLTGDTGGQLSADASTGGSCPPCGQVLGGGVWVLDQLRLRFHPTQTRVRGEKGERKTAAVGGVCWPGQVVTLQATPLVGQHSNSPPPCHMALTAGHCKPPS